MTAGLQLGRPGIFRVDIRPPAPLTGVRLDVAGFAGVALRGPVDEPTPVVSWADYERRFGAFERNVSGRDRLLPYAVQAFFGQGGARAWVLRVTAADGPDVPTADASTAQFAIADTEGWGLAAASEGSWGSGLEINIEFAVGAAFSARFVSADRVRPPAGAAPADGSLLRIRRADVPRGELRWSSVVVEPATGRRLLELDRPLPVGDDGTPAETAATVEVVTGTLVVDDPGSAGERIAGLGLHPDHPRFPPEVLPRESLLLQCRGEWTESLRPDRLLISRPYVPVQGGRDRSDAVGWDSFFDPGGAVDDPLDETPPRGVDALGRINEIGILCVPDLAWRTQPVPAAEPERPAGVVARSRHHCEGCAAPAPVIDVPDLPPAPRSFLDGRDDDDLRALVERQQRTVAIAELRRRFVALLDVPTSMPVGRIADWRAEFDSSFTAAFHPWLGVPRVDGQASDQTAQLVPPSAFAAGIMADRERRLGLSRGPANQLALGAIKAAEGIGELEADRLHQQSINVFAGERDGFRLSAARTLSTDQDYRQLSVRRLMTMLALTVERHGQWLVFEPNTVGLRSQLVDTLTQLLRDLHRQGAFSGATEEQSFFVRCDGSVNSPESQALGRLVAEIGVAPASPLEYLVLRIASDGDGGLVVDEAGRAGSLAESRELAGAGRV